MIVFLLHCQIFSLEAHRPPEHLYPDHQESLQRIELVADVKDL